MKSKRDYFSKYNQLKWYEKFILTICCYFPPIPRRIRDVEISIDLDEYEKKFLKAYKLKDLSQLDKKNILDFGCGEGGFSLTLANKLPSSEIIGIDLIEGQKTASEMKGNRRLNNLRFLITKSNQLPDNYFDYVFSHDSFEHFEDPKYILSEIIRVTKPKGFILIKFGPTWASPYGRHMGGTFKRSMPWLHLIIPEKIMMRIHSVYHNRSHLFENYKDLEVGLNKMTVKKALNIVKYFKSIELIEKDINYVWKGSVLQKIPYINELFSGSLYMKLIKH
jgi:ubiquinone/menaquinone biosynthesis C-methylase UbiE